MPLAHTGIEGIYPTFQDLREPIRGLQPRIEQRETTAEYYEQALRTGSLLRGTSTRLPDEIPTDTDKYRLPHGHDRYIDGEPYDIEAEGRIQDGIRHYRTPEY